MSKFASIENRILLLILLVGLILRLWNIDFGLPYMLHPDEGYEVRRALQLGTGSFDFSRIGKGGYFYVLFVEYGFLFAYAYLTGMVSNAQEFGVLYLTDPTAFYLVGRITTALVGTATIYFLYKLICRVSTKEVALAGATLLCVNSLHVEHSHYIAVDVPLTFWIVVSFYLFTFLPEKQTLKLYCLIGFSVACASMTKMPGILLLLPLLLFQLSTLRNSGKNLLEVIFNGRFIACCLIFLLVFVIGNPGVIVQYEKFLAFFSGFLADDSSVQVAQDVSDAVIIQSDEEMNASGPIGHFAFYAQALFGSLSPVVAVFSVLGVVLALLQRSVPFLIFAVYAGAFFVALGVSSFEGLVYQRYLLPLIPFILAFCAHGIGYLINMRPIARSSSGQYVFVIAVALLVSSQTVVEALERNARFDLPDTRQFAEGWFLENVGEGEAVLLEGATARPKIRTIPLQQSQENLTTAIQIFKEQGEAGKAYYFTVLRDKIDAKRYSLSFFDLDSPPEVSWLKEQKIQYVILNPELASHVKYKDGPFVEFMETIQTSPEFKLVFEVVGDNETMTGPDISVFKTNFIEH